MRDKVTKITRSMKRITALLTLFLAMTFISCKSGKTVGENPFFAEWETPYGVPPFDKIEPEHFLPAIERGMSLHEAEIDAITSNNDAPTFENVILAYDASGKMLSQVELIFGMLCAAENTSEMQALEEQIMPRMAAHADKIRLNGKLFERIKAEGHRIGNHTYSHQKGWRMTLEAYLEDVELANNLLHTDLFRPPYAQIKPSQARRLSEHYNLIMWDVLSQDYNRQISPRLCLRNVTKHVRGGSIVVFHDSLKSYRNMSYALPRTLEFLYERGLKCVGIEI